MYCSTENELDETKSWSYERSGLVSNKHSSLLQERIG